jgi:NADH-quinone oxidoreductase E subunit
MPVAVSPAARTKIDEIDARYPNAQAACLPTLHLAQAELGELDDDAVQAVAVALNLPVAHVHGVVTFYTMFHREKTGKNVLMVCTNVSCMLRGAYDILAHIEQKTGLKPGESNEDFTVVEEECLAACANAPAMICGTEYHLDLTREKVAQALEELGKNPKSENVG